MFGKKKELTGSAEAHKLIEDAFADMALTIDGVKGCFYIGGLAEMAFALGAITKQEKIDYQHKAYAIARKKN